MLKVADLQQLVSGFVAPVRSAGASQKVLDDLQRLGEVLEPFRDRSLAEFADFLKMADEYVRTGTLPATAGGRAPRAPKAPKLTVGEATQRVLALYERAADGSLGYDVIEREVQSLQPMTAKDLKEVATQTHVGVPSRATKDKILEAIRNAVQGRRAAADRTGLREPTTERLVEERPDGAAVGQAAARPAGESMAGAGEPQS
jgi:hypothetical protein